MADASTTPNSARFRGVFSSFIREKPIDRPVVTAIPRSPAVHWPPEWMGYDRGGKRRDSAGTGPPTIAATAITTWRGH